MRILYIDASMGAAGDMLMAALWSLLTPDKKQVFLQEMNQISGVTVEALDSEKMGVRGTRMRVSCAGYEEETSDVNLLPGASDGGGSETGGQLKDEAAAMPHGHSGAADIGELIQKQTQFSAEVRAQAGAVYRRIAEAEAEAHGTTVSEVHFHELGHLDALADVLGVSRLIEMLDAETTIASPIHVGAGLVHCAHGILPVPTPATALILRDVPIYGGQIQGELCTPTGAALLKQFCRSFAMMPVMRLKTVGYGFGHKNYTVLNCLRAYLGEAEEKRGSAAGASGESLREWLPGERLCYETVTSIACNLDDMSGEDLAYAQRLLLENGALEAYTVPIGMKKGRPGVMLVCLCRKDEKEKLAALLLRHTSTLGVRMQSQERLTLPRESQVLETSLGKLRVKTSGAGQHKKIKIEHDDLETVAAARGISLAEARELIERELTGRS